MRRNRGATGYFHTQVQRGLTEHTNGLLRQYIGKGESLFEVDPQPLRRAADLLNHRPRMALQFRTPHEVYSAACRAAGIPPPAACPRLCPV